MAKSKHKTYHQSRLSINFCLFKQKQQDKVLVYI